MPGVSATLNGGTSLVARKAMSIGPFVLHVGDSVTPEMQAHLPVGRLPQLISGGWLEQKVEYAAADEVADLRAEVAELRSIIATLTERRGPGRPRKIEDPA